MSDELKKLASRIEFLKDSTMFDAKERADACLHQLKIVLGDFDSRLRALEKGKK